ncbi:hypothetical protein ASF78_17300 [Cellulomonas sp. Leaf334]|nr:hypothetical protein ASF78_17300 [Cellulomonas sp. Leaf334]
MASIVQCCTSRSASVRAVTDSAPKPPLPAPGDVCTPDPRPGRVREAHDLTAPDHDDELQQVYAWLALSPVERAFTRAVDDAIRYVLDGSRTGRFDLMSPDVDSDERASVGTKLQYRILNELNLVKEPPLDTTILGIPVELKATVRSNWMIPTEGQCEICLLVQVDPAGARHRAFLMRTHRAWLRDGANKDGKRGVVSAALVQYALPILDWTPLPPEPLKRLTQPQLDVVFAPRAGQTERLTALFGYLPNVIMPRSSIETVCAGNRDPMRRARQAKPLVAGRHGLTLLCGTWREDLELATSRGFDISGDAWVALTPEALVRPETA